MFQTEDRRSKDRPRAPLQQVWLSSKPHGTSVRGLCRQDILFVEFAPAERGRGDADTPVKAVGFTSGQYYAFSSPPKLPYGEAVDDEHVPSEAHCGPLKGQQGRFFQAESEESAYEGYRAWLGLRAALKAGKPVPLECGLSPADPPKTCPEVILGIGQENFIDVMGCNWRSEPGRSCYRIDAEDREIEIVVDDDGADEPTIVRVKIETPIVFTHALID